MAIQFNVTDEIYARRECNNIVSLNLSDAPGLEIILNVYSQKIHGKSFIEILSQSIKKAYELLMQITDSEISAEILFMYLLKNIVSDESLAKTILGLVKKGKDIELKSILDQRSLM